MKLLLVENHAVFAKIVISQFLAAHEVSVAATVADACRRCEETPFDAVFVDYDLDDGKGTEVVRFLRARGNSTFIVAVSSKQDGNEALMAAGANASCSKMKFAEIDAVLSARPR